MAFVADVERPIAFYGMDAGCRIDFTRRWLARAGPPVAKGRRPTAGCRGPSAAR